MQGVQEGAWEGCMWEDLAGRHGVSVGADLEWEVEAVLLWLRRKGELAVAHDEEARVADVCPEQFLALDAEDHRGA